MGITPDDPGWYDRPSAYHDTDNTLHLRASSIGGTCHHRLALDAIAYADPGRIPATPAPPDKYLLNAMEESAALEQQAYDLWWDAAEIGTFPWDGWVNGPEAEWVQLQVGDHVVIDGTTDFSILNPDTDEIITVEIKAVGEKLYEELLATEDEPWWRLSGLPLKYRWQVATYAHAMNRPCVLAVCEKKDGALTGRVFPHTYGPFDTDHVPQLHHFATTGHLVNAHIGEIETERAWTCDKADSTCRWAEVCQKPVEVDDVKITGLVEVYRDAEAVAKKAVGQVDRLKAELRSIAEQHGGRIIDTAGNKVTVTTSDIPERVAVTKAHTRTTVRITPKKED